MKNMYAKLTISILFALCLFPIQANATAYYVDFTAGIANGDGLATTTPFNNLDSFTEAARSAGDIAFMRRGVASTTGVSSVDFTSDGAINNPIIVSVDYDNLWNEFATSSVSFTTNAGTTTLIASGSIVDIAAGDWIYIMGDCTETYNDTSYTPCNFSYEVKAVNGTLLDLFIPYKGNQSGSGLEVRIMPDQPIIGLVSSNITMNLNTDLYWIIDGLDFRSTAGDITLAGNNGFWLFKDCIFRANGSGDIWITTSATAGVADLMIKKTRAINALTGFNYIANSVAHPGRLRIEDSYFDMSDVASATFLDRTTDAIPWKMDIYISDSFLINATQVLDIDTDDDVSNFYFRNFIFGSDVVTPYNNINLSEGSFVFVEDSDGEMGKNELYGVLSRTESLPYISSTSTLRTGGGANTIQVSPTAAVDESFYTTHIKLFDYAIYTNTTSRQYDFYFRTSTTTTEWTANPTASQLWIECDYWAHNTSKDTTATSSRKVKKSTGTVDFAGNADWQTLSVTCAPTQTGILYLRGFYGKSRETSQSNEFLIDSTPVVTP